MNDRFKLTEVGHSGPSQRSVQCRVAMGTNTGSEAVALRRQNVAEEIVWEVDSSIKNVLPTAQVCFIRF